MNTHAEKTQENRSPAGRQESQSVTNSVAQKQSSSESTFQLVDNRPETILQRRLIQMVKKSSKGQIPLQKKAALEEEEILQGKFKTIQEKGLEEEELIQGKFEAIQKQGIEEEELQMKAAPIQKKSGADSLQEQAAISKPVQKNNTGLPDNLKSGIENLSGMSLDDVKVHRNSDKPAQLQAHAYAQGTDIHLGPGQEKHLPHEAWHVVQQKQGRVKPTLQLKGKVNVNDDPGLEKEADVMGAKAGLVTPRVSQYQNKQFNFNTISNGSLKQKRKFSIVQLMPTSTYIKQVHGEPKTKEDKQKAYKGILKAIDDFHAVRIAMVPKNHPTDVADSFAALKAEYEKVLSKLDAYLKGKMKKKPAARSRKQYFEQLESQTKEALIQANRAQQIISVALVHAKPTLNKVDNPVEMGGALNKVYKYAEGFFKEGHKTLPSSEKLAELDAEISQISKQKQVFVDKGIAIKRGDGNYKGEPVTETLEEIEERKSFFSAQEREKTPALTATQNTVNTLGAAGIKPEGANTSNRDVASSRLDELLGGGIIAKAEFALEKNGVNTKEGIYMAIADGDRIGDLGNQGKITNNKKQQGANKMYANDPNFMRQLSRLQLLDTLALQVDRNLGNFFVKLDVSGNVVKLTGIDNDMSFGEKDDIDNKVMEYPGLSKYVDEEMANSILALDDKVLSLTMAGLVSAAELAALLSRLQKLKTHLQALKNNKKLLKPSQWNDAIAKKLLDEKSSYFSEIKEKVQ